MLHLGDESYLLIKPKIQRLYKSYKFFQSYYSLNLPSI
jgi:hypothetical protein